MARIGVVALVIASVLGGCSAPSGSIATAPPASVTASSSVVSSPQSSVPGSPAEVAGLPVLSVEHAVGLLKAGKLDGQAVAVSGYFDQEIAPCAYPGQYIGPLESWCRFVVFADTKAAAQRCSVNGCNGPTGPYLAPWFEAETSGDPSSFQASGQSAEPVALVIIGHAGDARQWQCTAATQTQCASAFVVDRVAWADGHDIPTVASQVGDDLAGNPNPRMTLVQVAAAVGSGADLLTGAALRAGDIATVDPRWNLSGDTIVWLARTLGPASEAGSVETRSETEWLVDDATGKVIDSQPLKVAADYQPARLWQMATVHGPDCCTGVVLAFYRVAAADGTVVYDGMVRGASSGSSGALTIGGGYQSGPLLLPAGQYTISAWLATMNGQVAGSPRGECSSQVTLRPLDDVALNADFPSGKACTFGPAPSSSPGF